MAGIFTRFTLRSLAQNRVRTAVTVVGIALSTALLAAVLTSVASVQQGLLERTLVTEGSWHVYSPDVPAQGIDALVESDAVTDLATFRDLGSAALAPDDANRLGAFIALKTAPTTVKGVDEPGGAPYSLMPELASGRWPETAGEIVLPDYLQGEELGAGGAEGVVSNGPLETGSTLTGGFGNLAAAEDGARLADGNETRVENARERTLTVTGFYKRQAPFLANNYTASSAPSVALTVADASEEGAAAGAYLVTQGLGTLDEMKAFFADATGLDDTAATLYHTSLFSYLGISDGRPIWGSLWAVAAVLAVVIVVASVSLIYNAFAISVAERTRQFGLLASLGASKRQLRRTVLAEALLLGAVGVPLGLLAGVAGGHRFDLARQVCEERRLLAIDAQKDESDVHGQRDEKPVPEQSHAVVHGVGVRQRFTGRQPVEDMNRRLNAEQQRDGEDRDECGHAGRLDLGARLVHGGLLVIGWLPVYAET